MTVPIQMQGFMAADLTGVFVYDMPIAVQIGTLNYIALQDDFQTVEIDAYAGPENLDIQRLHFPTFTTTGANGIVILGLPSIENGDTILVEPGTSRQRTKIVVSSITSADENELIVTVRGN